MEIGKVSKPSIGNAGEFYLAALLSPLNPAMSSLPFLYHPSPRAWAERPESTTNY